MQKCRELVRGERLCSPFAFRLQASGPHLSLLADRFSRFRRSLLAYRFSLIALCLRCLLLGKLTPSEWSLKTQDLDGFFRQVFEE